MFERGFKSWCENVAVLQRKNLGCLVTDPLDPMKLAKSLSVNVWQADQVPGLDKDSLRVLTQDDPSSWSALTLSLGEKTLIVMNHAHYPTRQASNLMHEISHILIGHKGGRVDVTDEGLLMRTNFDKKQEGEADWLAGALLLPRLGLLAARSKGWTDNQIAKAYGISEDMVRYRVSMSGVDLQLKRKSQYARKIS